MCFLIEYQCFGVVDVRRACLHDRRARMTASGGVRLLSCGHRLRLAGINTKEESTEAARGLPAYRRRPCASAVTSASQDCGVMDVG